MPFLFDAFAIIKIHGGKPLGMVKMKGSSKSMSFICMIQNQNGIVAIADSKSTYISSEEIYEEKFRDTVKLFCGPSYIVATCDTNTITYPNGDYLYLENLIQKEVKGTSNVKELIDKIYHFISHYQDKRKNYNFTFFIGYKETNKDNQNRLVTQLISISNNGIQCGNPEYNKKILAGGCHSQLVNRLDVNSNWSIEEMINKAKVLIHMSMNLEKEFKTYSAVGGKIRLCTMDKEGNTSEVKIVETSS